MSVKVKNETKDKVMGDFGFWMFLIVVVLVHEFGGDIHELIQSYTKH